MTMFTVKGDGLEKLHHRFRQKAAALVDTKPILQKAAPQLIRILKRNIEDFRPGSVPDLKEATKKRKQKQVGFIYPILKRFGDMMDSMAAVVTKASIGVEFRGVNREGVRNSRVARVHLRGEGRNPKRDFFKIPKTFRDSIIDAVRAKFRRS